MQYLCQSTFGPPDTLVTIMTTTAATTARSSIETKSLTLT